MTRIKNAPTATVEESPDTLTQIDTDFVTAILASDGRLDLPATIAEIKEMTSEQADDFIRLAINSTQERFRSLCVLDFIADLILKAIVKLGIENEKSNKLVTMLRAILMDKAKIVYYEQNDSTRNKAYATSGTDEEESDVVQSENRKDVSEPSWARR